MDGWMVRGNDSIERANCELPQLKAQLMNMHRDRASYLLSVS